MWESLTNRFVDGLLKLVNKSAQAGIVHVGLIIGLIVIGVAGVYISQNHKDLFDGTQAASGKGSFSSISAVLKQDSATFNFSYSSFSPNYKIDISTSSNMKQNLYRNFGQGSSSPIIVSNPQSKWAPYQCGSTLYWIVKATDERSRGEVKSSVQTTKVDCSLTPTPSPTALPSPTPACTPQTKPGTVTLQGADGTWCNDSDGNGNYTNPGNCQDSCSSTNDYCQADGTNRDGYCTGTWNGSTWNSVHCEFGGYVCSSFGKICSGGACTGSLPTPTPTSAVCSWTTDSICPSNCAAGSDADCCTQKGYYILMANLGDTQASCAPGCYQTSYTTGTTACMTCSGTSDGACPNWCAAGSDKDCCIQAGKQWVNGGCF